MKKILQKAKSHFRSSFKFNFSHKALSSKKTIETIDELSHVVAKFIEVEDDQSSRRHVNEKQIKRIARLSNVEVEDSQLMMRSK